MKKVSIIVPCYQLKQEWLDRLFYSLERQTIGLKELEIIFVIDASPDDTFHRLQLYEEKWKENVLLVNCEEKVGPGGARSLGIQYSAGEYVAFVDQDDWVEPTMYEHLYEKALRYDCDVVESYNTRDESYLYHEGEPKRTGREDTFFVLRTPEERKRYFAKERPEVRKYWAKIYRRSFLIEYGIDFPKNVKYDDNYFKGMVFYHAQRVYVLEEYHYHWMINRESISMKNDMDAHFDRMKVELLKLEEYRRRELLPLYREEMEYIFLEQFYANTFQTISTRNGGVFLEVLEYMREKTRVYFPEYERNSYILSRNPVWAMGYWIENALRGIAQVRGRKVEVPERVLEKIAPLSFLDLLKVELTQEELNWYCSIYNAFDKVAARIDYCRLQEEKRNESDGEQQAVLPPKVVFDTTPPKMGEYVWIFGGKVKNLPEGEMKQFLQENKIEAGVLMEKSETPERCREGDCLSLEDALLDERYTEKGILLEKLLLQEAGGINTRLEAKWEYELLLRVCAMGKNVVVLHMQGESVCREEAIGISEKDSMEVPTADRQENVEAWYGFCTDAYVAGRYSAILQQKGLFNSVIEAVLTEGTATGREEEAQHFLEEMIAHTESYYHYYDATQPILIYLGPTYCYNILNVFAKELAEALKKQGQRIVFYETEKEDVNGIAALAGKRYKASIGFQTWLMSVKRREKEKHFQDMIGGPKFNFILDHPIWLDHQLRDVPQRFYVLTHDRNYQAFIRKYYKGVKETYLLPPGGRRALGWKNQGEREKEEERPYDITFLGTYGNYRKKLRMVLDCVPRIKFLAAKYLLYMTQKPERTAEEAFQMALDHYGIALGKEEFITLFGEMKPIIQCVMYYYREKTIETLLMAGLEVHVYGDSWRESPFFGSPFLKLHKEVRAEKGWEVLGASKISLNVMAWHKDGFTERIADSMLAGAVVVSDRSTQLEEQYSKETVLFDLKQLKKLPEKIKELLECPKKRREIAERAREKANKLATWDVRGTELLDIIERESDRDTWKRKDW